MNPLHFIQTKILRELLFIPHAKFSELNTVDIPNDHFTFHLKQLIRAGLIIKNENTYSLTPKGMEIAGRIDADQSIVFQQPKVSVSITVLNKINGIDHVLILHRKRAPSAGKYAWYTTKVRMGELLSQSCERCLLTETGLKAQFDYAGLLHVIRKQDENYEIDVVLPHFKATQVQGELISETDEGENIWIPVEEIKNLENTLIGFRETLDAVIEDKPFFLEFVTEVK